MPSASSSGPATPPCDRCKTTSRSQEARATRCSPPTRCRGGPGWTATTTYSRPGRRPCWITRTPRSEPLPPKPPRRSRPFSVPRTVTGTCSTSSNAPDPTRRPADGHGGWRGVALSPAASVGAPGLWTGDDRGLSLQAAWQGREPIAKATRPGPNAAAATARAAPAGLWLGAVRPPKRSVDSPATGLVVRCSGCAAPLAPLSFSPGGGDRLSSISSGREGPDDAGDSRERGQPFLYPEESDT